MKFETDPKVEAARAAHEEAKRQRAEAEAALSAASAALKAYEAACSAVAETGRLLDDALGLDVMEVGRGADWCRVVITRRTKKSVWVRTYGLPGSGETRFVLSRGTWRRHGDGHRKNPILLRGVP